MKIALVINEFNIRGGTHKQLHRLCEFLLKNKYETTIFTKFYNPLNCYPGNELFKIVSYDERYQKVNKTKGWRRLIKTVILDWTIANDISKYATIVNIHDSGLEFINIFLIFKFKQIPIVWQINDLHPAFNIGNSKDLKVNKLLLYYKSIVKYIAKNNSAITVNVSKNVQRVKEYLNCDAYLFHCGVDIRNNSFRPSKVNENSITLMSTGVFFTFRNYETLLKIQKYLQEKFNLIVNSIIVGSTAMDEVYVNKIRSIIKEDKLDCSIRGDISEKQLLEIYYKADFFLFLNVDQSWGLSVFESMNMCIPTIVSKSVGAVELLQNGKTALIVDPLNHEKIGDLIYEYYKKPALRDELINQAFNESLKMSWDSMYCSKMLGLFHSVVKNQHNH